jgi:hypothetical protein
VDGSDGTDGQDGSDGNDGIYLDSPVAVGSILSLSLLIGSCISLLPYAFNIIKTRVLEPKNRRKLGDLDSWEGRH